ncbi:hypothetical protein [Mesorhizobium sp.]|nr:hypothetical protein [Mesorhizobium sp.]
MAKDLSRSEAQRGTRRVLMWGVAFAFAIFVVLLVVFGLLPSSG